MNNKELYQVFVSLDKGDRFVYDDITTGQVSKFIKIQESRSQPGKLCIIHESGLFGSRQVKYFLGVFTFTEKYNPVA